MARFQKWWEQEKPHAVAQLNQMVEVRHYPQAGVVQIFTLGTIGGELRTMKGGTTIHLDKLSRSDRQKLIKVLQDADAMEAARETKQDDLAKANEELAKKAGVSPS